MTAIQSLKEKVADCKLRGAIGASFSIEELEPLLDRLERLESERAMMVEGLELVAAPIRADGTYNRCREACEQIARDILSRIKEQK